ncbi:hypothetical protein DY000_02052157 [Brassica cretica]|uniref:Uncharacterized protein n=1 Tax=Brassica cretica TaxID=69181 RepID=A0ABQ7ALQ3_BRACR|nr:hypothetical protein DY000_02052157 [Brassica cretica]
MALLLLHPPSLPPRAEGNGNSEESAHARPYSSDASGEIRSGPIAATTCHEQTSLLDEFSHGDHNNDKLLLVLDYADEILHTITFKTSSSSGLSRELSLEKKIRSRDAETFPLHGSSASSEMRTTLVNEGYSSQSGRLGTSF